MREKVRSAAVSMRVPGSFTVEAAIIFPIVLFCTSWMMEKGIILYTETVQHIEYQEIWEEFHPAEEFRKWEMLKELANVGVNVSSGI